MTIDRRVYRATDRDAPLRPRRRHGEAEGGGGQVGAQAARFRLRSGSSSFIAMHLRPQRRPRRVARGGEGKRMSDSVSGCFWLLVAFVISFIILLALGSGGDDQCDPTP